ncbi:MULTISPECIES: diacylglycerol/lipid kinase family protein [Streptosporangium]|uniref:YegS/Rv2252/BmrU family lipid kinase n=1 Tax=Streptosporangium brasiliense TaxID=47480 RepID=A0ABT9RAC9_9ACTN|nr:diacylglycerol kinase family protein [Streptosporangium brasiliense]MDP9866208.1 YegS/Rv2252/BmrU family lipid kinase [Streptosporangium brasiliense]
MLRQKRAVGTVAVIAHQKKSIGGGLDELRRLLADEEPGKLLWYEVPKSKKAPKQARKALKEGAELVLVWGGDGMVQRCVDALAGSGVTVGIIPAGTANLLAQNLGIPEDLPEAVRIAFWGQSRELDLGKVNGEHFAVMAGLGFDAEMIKDADRGLKDKLGRAAYVWTGLRHVRGELVRMEVKLDGVKWFEGEASCLLLGNVGTITGGIEAFDDARPDDGWLEIGVSTAKGPIQWARVLGRMSAGRSDESPFVRMTRARKISVKLGAPMTYELDGGAKDSVTRLKAKVVPGGITVRVPVPDGPDGRT